jgi:hypothetical protein
VRRRPDYDAFRFGLVWALAGVRVLRERCHGQNHTSKDDKCFHDSSPYFAPLQARSFRLARGALVAK